MAPDASDAEQVARLLQSQYWTQSFTPECMARAQRGSTAWIVARDAIGNVTASARAISDQGRLGMCSTSSYAKTRAARVWEKRSCVSCSNTLPCAS